MKISITGHTAGIGAAMADVFEKNGHMIVGFSQTNGFDISDPLSRAKMIELSRESDIFINNAYDWDGDPFAQTQLLFDLWQSWEGQQRSIINISSSSTMRWETHPKSLRYPTSKRCLEDACEFLWNRSPWPSVSVIAPCLTDSMVTKNNHSPNKVDPVHFADLLYHITQIPHFRVQMLKLAVNPVDKI